MPESRHPIATKTSAKITNSIIAIIRYGSPCIICVLMQPNKKMYVDRRLLEWIKQRVVYLFLGNGRGGVDDSLLLIVILVT